MRVTNEQAKAVVSTSVHYMDEVTGVTTDDIAADLLEARELIKEMREVLVEADTNALGYKCSCDICTKARTLIDKTKGYAE